MKLVTPSKQHLEKHYEDLSEKPFFKGLVTCMSFYKLVPFEACHLILFPRYVKRSYLRNGLGGA